MKTQLDRTDEAGGYQLPSESQAGLWDPRRHFRSLGCMVTSSVPAAQANDPTVVGAPALLP